MKFACPLLMTAAVLLPASARAGEAACWLDQGVLVVPALVAGVPGDFILDTGEPRTLLHETRAQAAGIAEASLAGQVKLAGMTFENRPVQVADLDARTWSLPTPIAGVIGADVLEGLVLDVNWAPCRVALYAKGKAPRRKALGVLRLTLIDGRVTARGEAFDGARLAKGRFVLATGSAAAVTLNQAIVLNAAPTDAEPPLRFLGVSLGKDIAWQAPTRVAPDGPDVTLGAPILMAHPLRFDLARHRLSILPAAQQKSPPERTGGP